MKEEQWIQQAKMGDMDAFDQLIDHHYLTVKKFAYQIGVKPESVDDVTQEVFLKVYRFLQKYTYGTFTTWLYQMTLNVIRDMKRKELSERRKEAEWRRQPFYDHYEEPAFNHELQELHEYIWELDEMYRVPLILYYFHDLSHQEIAQVINKSESAVKTRVMRARKQLKAQFEKVGVFHES